MTAPRSTDGFLTTHTGSLPRPPDLIRMMYAKEEGVPVDAAALGARIRAAVAEAVQKQVKAGVAIVNDGEMSHPSHEAYRFAIAEAMRHEYEAVARAGFILQLDCPDLGMGRHIQFADLSLDEFRTMARLHIEAMNRALANVPPDRSRLHVCWGNYEGPHHHDVALADIIDVVFDARPAGLSFEAANPRHA